MRVVIMGTSSIAIETAKEFIKDNYDVIIIESNQENIENLSEELDCNFIHGDGTRPEILEECDPKSIDILMCLTNHDQNNIIAALVGKSIGFEKIIVNVTDYEWKKICSELGLDNTVLSAHIISKHLKELAEGRNIFTLSNVVKNKMTIFSFNATKKQAGEIKALNLPKNSKIIWINRQDKFLLTDNNTKIKPNDEVVIAADENSIDKLKKLFCNKK